MADSALLYLQQGASQHLDEHSPVCWQRSPSDSVSQGILAEALDDLQGQGVQVIISAADCLLAQVQLSRKQAGHLQQVLPYLLEEQLLEEPQSLCFVAGKPQQDSYPIVVVARALLQGLQGYFEQADVQVLSLRVDADVLAVQAPLQVNLAGHWLLIANREQALVVDNAQYPQLLALFGQSFADEADILDNPATIIQALRQGGPGGIGVDLLSAIGRSRKQRQTERSPWTPWKPLLGLAATVALVGLLSLWVQQWRYQQAANQAEQQAQQLYESLFPGDRATAALRRQFQGRLQRLGAAGGADARFLALLAPVAEGLNDARVSPRRMQFEQRDGSLTLDVSAKDYNQLETLQSAIRQRGVEASIANYRNDQSGVNARLKVEQRG